MNPSTSVNASLFSGKLAQALKTSANLGKEESKFHTFIAFLSSPFSHVTLTTTFVLEENVEAVSLDHQDYFKGVSFEKDEEAKFEKIFVVNGFDENKKIVSKKFVDDVDPHTCGDNLTTDDGIKVLSPYTVFTWLKLKSQSYEDQTKKIFNDFKEKYPQELDQRFQVSLHATVGTYWKLREGEHVEDNRILTREGTPPPTFQNLEKEDLFNAAIIHNTIKVEDVESFSFDSVRISKKVQNRFQPPVDIPLKN